LFLVLLISYIYFLPRWADPNQNSRLNMIVAAVDQGTLRIDDYVDNTVDYAKFEGHYYSDKAPGIALLGIPVYAAIKPFLNLSPISQILERAAYSDAFVDTLNKAGTGLFINKIHFAVAQIAATWVVISLPAALLGVLLYRFMGHFTLHEGHRLMVALIYGLATIAFPYAGALYGHQLVAFFLFTAFYLLFTGSSSYSDDRASSFLARYRISNERLILSGFLLGWSVITEYPAAILAGLIFLYSLYRLSDHRRALWMVLGGLPPVLLAVALNLAMFRTPLPVGYRYSELWVEQHSTGFMSLVLPRPAALWGITFDPFRGLFFLSPVLLLALPGLYVLWNRRQWRAEFWLSTLGLVGFFLFNSASIMWWGGYSIGPRYLVPILPFLTWPLIMWLDHWGNRLWIYFLTMVLTLWSFLLVWGETLGGQAFPPDTIRDTLGGYTWPHLRAGDIARNLGMILDLKGWMSLLPLTVVLTLLLLVLVRRPSSKKAQDSTRQTLPGLFTQGANKPITIISREDAS
jgi:hypothetical protein